MSLMEFSPTQVTGLHRLNRHRISTARKKNVNKKKILLGNIKVIGNYVTAFAGKKVTAPL
jgi:hypothetical protein